MTEPAVTLTDYALAIEAAVFVFALVRPEVRDRTVRFWFVVFFAFHPFYRGSINSLSAPQIPPATLPQPT